MKITVNIQVDDEKNGACLSGIVQFDETGKVISRQVYSTNMFNKTKGLGSNCKKPLIKSILGNVANYIRGEIVKFDRG